tara:strand:- start:223 stop:813 length:591 start_codon:yes stop_codon:yes gene_type:complete
MIKKIILSLSFVLLLSSAKASEYYASLEIGEFNLVPDVTNVSSVLDAKDTIYIITGGYNLDEQTAIEVFYVDFGEATLSGTSGNQFRIDGVLYEFNQAATIKLTADGIGTGFKYDLAKDARSNAYFKAGLYTWDASYDISTGTASGSTSDDGTDFYFGLGASYTFNENAKGTLSYMNFNGDDGDIDGLTFGLEIDF